MDTAKTIICVLLSIAGVFTCVVGIILWQWVREIPTTAIFLTVGLLFIACGVGIFRQRGKS